MNKQHIHLMIKSNLGMKSRKSNNTEDYTPQPPNAEASQRDNMQLLENCKTYWEALEDFRYRARRARNYYRGKQWNDIIFDPAENKYVTEDYYIRKQGKVPLKNNQIRQLIKNIVGQYESNPTQSIVLSRHTDGQNSGVPEMLTNALQYAQEINRAQLLDSRNFERFLLSGIAIQNIGFEYIKERDTQDIVINNVNPNNIFFNTDIQDPRLKDLRIIGEIIDTTVDKIVSVFAKTREEEQYLRELYSHIAERDIVVVDNLSANRTDNLDFYIPSDPSTARIFAVWYLRGTWKMYVHDPLDGTYKIEETTREEIALRNAERLQTYLEAGISIDECPLLEATDKYEEEWYVKYLTPNGDCLFESVTPYAHQSHPYAMLCYPLLDGEVWGLVEDIIDQQKMINRMITLYDFIISSSAKGVLMIPSDVIDDSKMTLEQMKAEYARVGGVILYKVKDHRQIPQQIISNSMSVGVNEMINIMMTMIKQISGVSGAIQGQDALSGKAASLYAQEAQNSTINNLDYTISYNDYIRTRNRKILKTIIQYYKEKRYLLINGKTTNESSQIYDPSLIVSDTDFDIVITQGQDAPTYKQVIDGTLRELLFNGLITLEMYLEQSTLPFADSLLATVRKAKEQQAAGAMPTSDIANGIVEAGQQANIASSINPAAQQLLQQNITA